MHRSDMVCCPLRKLYVPEPCTRAAVDPGCRLSRSGPTASTWAGMRMVRLAKRPRSRAVRPRVGHGDSHVARSPAHPRGVARRVRHPARSQRGSRRRVRAESAVAMADGIRNAFESPNPAGPGADCRGFAPTLPLVATPPVPDKPEPNRGLALRRGWIRCDGREVQPGRGSYDPRSPCCLGSVTRRV